MEIVTAESKPLDLTKDANYQAVYIARGIFETFEKVGNGKRIGQVQLNGEDITFTGEGKPPHRMVKLVSDGSIYWTTEQSVVTVAVAKIWER